MSWWLPVVIFLAETCVVTSGTVRTIFVARGMKVQAAFLGLIEAGIWLFAIGQVVTNLSHIPCSIAYAAGFTVGVFLGMWMEEQIALGVQVVRIITKDQADGLIERLTHNNFGVTSVEANGATGPVRIIFSIVKRKQIPEVAQIIRQFDRSIFYTVEDVRTVRKGVFRGQEELAIANVPYHVRVEQETIQLSPIPAEYIQAAAPTTKKAA